MGYSLFRPNHKQSSFRHTKLTVMPLATSVIGLQKPARRHAGRRGVVGGLLQVLHVLGLDDVAGSEHVLVLLVDRSPIAVEGMLELVPRSVA